MLVYLTQVDLDDRGKMLQYFPIQRPTLPQSSHRVAVA